MKKSVRDRILMVFLGVLFLGIPLHAQAQYDKNYVGDVVHYRAKYEDTFVHLARDYNLGFVEMRAANPDVDPWIPGRGKKLLLPTRHLLPEAPRKGVVINLPEMRLYAYINGDDAPTTFPIGVGREGLDTPLGTTKVVRKTEKPIWRPTARMRREDPELPEVVHPGPENPLGTHALYLGWPTYAIHGTNRPFGIGRRISSGCIRLYPENITKLYELIPTGTPVTVVNQPIKATWIGNKLYIEAHPELGQAIEMEETGVIKSPSLSDEDLARIIKVAGKHQDRLHWSTIRTAIRERKGYPVMIARRPHSRDDGANDETAEDDSEFKENLEKGKEQLKNVYENSEADDKQEKTAAYEDKAQEPHVPHNHNP